MSARAPVLARVLAVLVLLGGGGSADARGTGAKKGSGRTSAAKSSSGKKPSASSSSGSSGSKRLAKSERGRGKRHDKRRRSYAPPQMPQTLELMDLDLVTGFAHVVAVGTTRVPDARLFVLTDDRGRRFVPEQAECAAPPGVSIPPEALQPDEPGADEGGGEAPPERPASAAPVHETTASGGLAPINTRWRCTLTVSRLYRRARIVAVSMEWGQKAVDVPARMVADVWKKAVAAAPDVAVAQTAPAREAARPPPSPLPPEDAPEEEGPAESTRDVGATVE